MRRMFRWPILRCRVRAPVGWARWWPCGRHGHRDGPTLNSALAFVVLVGRSVASHQRAARSSVGVGALSMTAGPGWSVFPRGLLSTFVVGVAGPAWVVVSSCCARRLWVSPPGSRRGVASARRRRGRVGRVARARGTAGQRVGFLGWTCAGRSCRGVSAPPGSVCRRCPRRAGCWRPLSWAGCGCRPGRCRRRLPTRTPEGGLCTGGHRSKHRFGRCRGVRSGSPAETWMARRRVVWEVLRGRSGWLPPAASWAGCGRRRPGSPSGGAAGRGEALGRGPARRVSQGRSGAPVNTIVRLGSNVGKRALCAVFIPVRADVTGVVRGAAWAARPRDAESAERVLAPGV